MSDPVDSRPEVIGDPPTAVRPTFALEPDAVAVMLTAPSAPALMEQLGISETDRTELLELLPQLAADRELLTAVTEVANLLRAEAGLDAEPAALGEHTERLDALQERLRPGQGLLLIAAHLVSTDVVRAWHRVRGLDAEQSWLALSDLGQQLRVHRLTFGELGHHTVAWTALNWTGRLFWLGRLQFDLHRSGEGRWRIGTHIPATGPLAPAAVEESFAAAQQFFPSHFPDLAADSEGEVFGREFVCHSWLVNEELPRIIGPDSNLGDFAARWTVEKTFPAADDAVFFVFNQRPPYDVGDLPQRSRLQRAIIERIADGRGWLGGKGRLTR